MSIDVSMWCSNVLVMAYCAWQSVVGHQGFCLFIGALIPTNQHTHRHRLALVIYIRDNV